MYFNSFGQNKLIGVNILKVSSIMYTNKVYINNKVIIITKLFKNIVNNNPHRFILSDLFIIIRGGRRENFCPRLLRKIGD